MLRPIQVAFFFFLAFQHAFCQIAPFSTQVIIIAESFYYVNYYVKSWSNILSRAVARSENLGGHIVLSGDNVPPLVEIGLIDLPKSVGARAPPAPRLRRACLL